MTRLLGAKPPRYIETVWDYGSGYINTYDSEDASQIVENAIKDTFDLINDFVQKHDLYVKLFVVSYLDKQPTRPILGIGFSRSFIKMLSDLNAEIEIDMYLV